MSCLPLYRSFPFRGFGTLPNKHFADKPQGAGGQNTGVWLHFLCLLFFFSHTSTSKTGKCQQSPEKRKKTAACDVSNSSTDKKNGGFYSPVSLLFASCIPFAVAVIIIKSRLLISASRLSSCRRCVELSVSTFGKKNWSTDTSKKVTSS